MSTRVTHIGVCACACVLLYATIVGLFIQWVVEFFSIIKLRGGAEFKKKYIIVPMRMSVQYLHFQELLEAIGWKKKTSNL